jgi:sodium transport system ATP-binding protein
MKANFNIKREGAMVEIVNLTKVYKLTRKQQRLLKTTNPFKTAVNELNLKVRAGEIYGLLGANGAGKTTTLRCMATLIKPTDGEIYISGDEVQQRPDRIRQKIGFLTQDMKLDAQFTPYELFEFFARLHQVPKEELNERREELFRYFEIGDCAYKRMRELSSGMAQKVAIAVCMAHDPHIVMLDEPMNGLDVITARSVRNYIKRLKKEGKLVIVSTHVMSEAEKLCDRIGIMMDGRKVADGSLDQILCDTNSNDLEDAFVKLYRQAKGEEEQWRR